MRPFTKIIAVICWIIVIINQVNRLIIDPQYANLSGFLCGWLIGIPYITFGKIKWLSNVGLWALISAGFDVIARVYGFIWFENLWTSIPAILYILLFERQMYVPKET